VMVAMSAAATSLIARAGNGVPSSRHGSGLFGRPRGSTQRGHMSSGVGKARRAELAVRPWASVIVGANDAHTCSPRRLVRPYTSLASGGAVGSMGRWPKPSYTDMLLTWTNEPAPALAAASSAVCTDATFTA